MEAPIRKVDGIEREDADAIRPTRSALDCRRAGNRGALDGRHKGAIDYGLDEEHVVDATPLRITLSTPEPRARPPKEPTTAQSAVVLESPCGPGGPWIPCAPLRPLHPREAAGATRPAVAPQRLRTEHRARGQPRVSSRSSATRELHAASRSFRWPQIAGRATSSNAPLTLQTYGRISAQCRTKAVVSRTVCSKSSRRKTLNGEWM